MTTRTIFEQTKKKKTKRKKRKRRREKIDRMCTRTVVHFTLSLRWEVHDHHHHLAQSYLFLPFLSLKVHIQYKSLHSLFKYDIKRKAFSPTHLKHNSHLIFYNRLYSFSFVFFCLACLFINFHWITALFRLLRCFQFG